MSKNIKNTGSLGDQLKSKGALLSSPTMNHPSQWKGDGVDHINVSRSSTTQIGKWLNGRNSFPFRHPILGQFRSIDNLSMFIRSSTFDDRIRNMDSFARMRTLIDQSGGLRKNLANYEALMVHAVYIRVLLNESLMQQLINSDLPFDSYTVDTETGLRQRFEPSRFLCDGYTEIRKALQERRSIQLNRFINGKAAGLDIYEDLMSKLAPDYQGNSHLVMARFEELRWAAYDEWAEKQSRGTKQQQARNVADKDVKVKKKKPVEQVEEIGGIGTDVIDSTDEPKGVKEGTRWFNPVQNDTYIRIIGSREGLGKIWMSLTDLAEKALEDKGNKRFVTSNFAAHKDRLAQFCFDNDWVLYNPITGETLHCFSDRGNGEFSWVLPTVNSALSSQTFISKEGAEYNLNGDDLRDFVVQQSGRSESQAKSWPPLTKSEPTALFTLAPSADGSAVADFERGCQPPILPLDELALATVAAKTGVRVEVLKSFADLESVSAPTLSTSTNTEPSEALDESFCLEAEKEEITEKIRDGALELYAQSEKSNSESSTVSLDDGSVMTANSQLAQLQAAE